MTDEIVFRLYQHPETRARVVRLEGADEDERPEIDAFGWRHKAGDQILIEGARYAITWVGSCIHTDDPSGHYIGASARPRARPQTSHE